MILNTKVLLLGIDSVGKTSLLYKLKFGENVYTIPTIGFNVESIKYKDKNITIWDLAGGNLVQKFWHHYIEKSNLIIFQMNISDKQRLNEYIESLEDLLKKHKDQRHIPILLLGNKFKDQIEFEPEEILQKVNFPPEISPTIMKCNVKTGEGLQELLDYIYDNMEFIEEEIKEENNHEEKEQKEENNQEEKEQKEETPKKKKQDIQVSMFGLDCAGKTVILYLLKFGSKVTTITTIGYNIETFENESWEKSITIVDIGGNEKIRALWYYYLLDCKGLIWVYDINDQNRYNESANELKKILNYPYTGKNLPLLIFANKSDLNNDKNYVNQFLDLIKAELKDRPYMIQKSNQNDIETYKQGLNWLYENIN